MKKIRHKQGLSHKAVLKYLIERLTTANVLLENNNQKYIVDTYVDHFGTNPIEDYKKRVIVKKPLKAKVVKIKKPKFTFPDYRHPKWKAKRMQVLRRDKFTCRGCESRKNLQCHHSYYEMGKYIWEYPLSSLVTLCKDCHEKFHEKIKGKDLVKRK